MLLFNLPALLFRKLPLLLAILHYPALTSFSPGLSLFRHTLRIRLRGFGGFRVEKLFFKPLPFCLHSDALVSR